MSDYDLEQLKEAFDKEARDFYRITKQKCPKLTSIILDMFDRHKGAHQAAKVLLNKGEVSNGFTLLWEADRNGLSLMKYTMEAMVLNPKYSPLFNGKDKKEARRRLEAYRFDVDGYIQSLPEEVAPVHDEIRLIPMSPTEFGNSTIEQVQTDYFQQKLPYDDNNRYGYYERGINCGRGALLLFQLHNNIIASALFESIDKDKREILLVSGSIVVFEPITKDELSSVDRNFKGFTQSKQHLNPQCKDALLTLINNRKRYLNPEDFGEAPKPTSTECDQLVKARIGQAGFRKDLLELDGKCRICGLDLQPILKASHIKPWKDSGDKERLDKFNGLLLCPTHDALFDEGYISFGDSGRILISQQINKSMYGVLGINDNTQIAIYPQNKKYLEWHRNQIKQ